MLEDANLKLASVATDALGASGRAMLKAIVTGEQDVEKLADMSRGLLRRKIPELQLALQGHVSRHHRFLLEELLDHREFIEAKMTRLEQEIADRLGPFEVTVRRLCTVPGIDRVSAWGIISEIGLDMHQFEDAKHLGGAVSRQLGERRQTKERENPQRERWAEAPSVPIGLGCLHQAEQLPLRPVPSGWPRVAA